jgi:hypothetical protein
LSDHFDAMEIIDPFPCLERESYDKKTTIPQIIDPGAGSLCIFHGMQYFHSTREYLDHCHRPGESCNANHSIDGYSDSTIPYVFETHRDRTPSFRNDDSHSPRIPDANHHPHTFNGYAYQHDRKGHFDRHRRSWRIRAGRGLR